MQCPAPWIVPLSNGQRSDLRLDAVGTALGEGRDSWWTVPEVRQYYQASQACRIGPSSIAGCGIIAERGIGAGERIGLVWVTDPAAKRFIFSKPRHLTPWFGLAINHCWTPNSRLESGPGGEGWSVALRDIAAGEEVTGNYDDDRRDFPLLDLMAAPKSWTC